jgi:hypothetical protein
MLAHALSGGAVLHRGNMQAHVFPLQFAQQVHARAESAGLRHSPDPVGKALPQRDLHPAHALNAAAERQVPVLPQHSRRLEHGHHAGGAREDGRERGCGRRQFGIHHQLAGDVAPAEVGRDATPDDEVRAVTGGELRGHGLRHRDREVERVEVPEASVHAGERAANARREPCGHVIIRPK